MDTILMIVLFALFAVLSDKIGQKPKVPRRPREEGSQLPPPAPAPWPRKAPAPKQTIPTTAKPLDATKSGNFR